VRIRSAAALLLVTVAGPVQAQDAHGVAAYFGTAFTTGGEAPHVEQPVLGDNVDTWGLHAFYSHQSASYWGAPDPFGAFHVNAFGGSVSASFLAGRLGLEGTGGRYTFSCAPGIDCKDGVMGGGSALFRLLRAPLSFDSGSRVTMSLRGAAAWSGTGGSDYKYVSATAGIPIALSAAEGTYRVVGFLTPGITWASVKAPVRVLTQFGSINTGSFEHDGTRGMLSGGIGVVPSVNGIGLSLGFQRIFVRQARTQFGVTLTWNMPKFGDR
jgi:hypothetical protein